MSRGAYDEPSSKVLQEYLARGPHRADRLKVLNDCLSEMVRGPDGGKLNVIGFMFGSAHAELRKNLIDLAREKGEPI